jgi:hypothetical protein
LYCTEEDASETSKNYVWQIQLGINWVTYDLDTEKLIHDAVNAGASTVEYCARRQSYIIDLKNMEQVNRVTGVRRAVRCVEEEAAEPEEPVHVQCPLTPPRPARLTCLVERLLSPAVQVQLPTAASEEPLRLSPAHVSEVFKEHVPGVEKFLYRDMAGKHSLEFIVKGYMHGLNAFIDTPLHDHLLWLLRIIVHYGHACKPGASKYLRDVAEAFRDCQAVQARAIEQVGLEICGVSFDFKGHVTKLIGDYKSMAIKMLAFEQIAQRRASDDSNPTHYENRLIEGLGDLVGLNQDEIRRAKLDEHRKRFAELSPPEQAAGSARCRELFDVEALLKALMAELNSFNFESPADSMPQQFLKWVSFSLKEKHVVFDVGTCMSVDVEESLVLAILEVLFFGRPSSLATVETYRGCHVEDLFILPRDSEVEYVMAQETSEDAQTQAEQESKVRSPVHKNQPGRKSRKGKKGSR